MVIVVYTLRGCPWCDAAKSKLRAHRLRFTEHETQHGAPSKRMPNGRQPDSFPQIWVDGVARGGYSDMDTWLTAAKTAAKTTSKPKKKLAVKMKKRPLTSKTKTKTKTKKPTAKKTTR